MLDDRKILIGKMQDQFQTLTDVSMSLCQNFHELLTLPQRFFAVFSQRKCHLLQQQYQYHHWLLVIKYREQFRQLNRYSYSFDPLGDQYLLKSGRCPHVIVVSFPLEYYCDNYYSATLLNQLIFLPHAWLGSCQFV